MKYLRYVALLALLTLPLAYSQAAVTVGVGIGPVGVGVAAGPPVCAYGYYPDYPYGCAPYGYYGPTWFVNGVFIGAGPWYHGWGHPVYPARPFVRGYVGRGPEVHGTIARRTFEARGPVASYRGGFRGRR